MIPMSRETVAPFRSDYAWPARPDWVEGAPSLRAISDDIARPLDTRPGAGWYGCLAASGAALALGVACVSYQIATGIGTWGLNKTVGWAFDITNFVFWIEIGRASCRERV